MKRNLVLIIVSLSLLSCSQINKKRSKKRQKEAISKYYSSKRNINLFYGPNISSFTPIAYPLKENDLEVDLSRAPIGLICKIGLYGQATNLKKITLKSKSSGNYNSIYCKYNNYVDFGKSEINVTYSIDKPQLRVIKDEFDYFQLKKIHKNKAANLELINFIDKSSQNNEVLILNKSNDFSEKIKVKNSTVFIKSFSHTSNGVFCTIGNHSFDSSGREDLILYDFTGSIVCNSTEKALVSLKLARRRTVSQNLFKEKKIIEVYDEAKIEFNELLFNLDFLNYTNKQQYQLKKNAYYSRDKIEKRFPTSIDGLLSDNGLEIQLKPSKLKIIYSKKLSESLKQLKVSVRNKVTLEANSESTKLKYKPFSFFQDFKLNSSDIWIEENQRKTFHYCKESISDTLKELQFGNKGILQRLKHYLDIAKKNQEKICKVHNPENFRMARSKSLFYIGDEVDDNKLIVSEIAVRFSGAIDGQIFEKSVVIDAPKKLAGKVIKRSKKYLILNGKIYSKRIKK